MKAEPHEMWLMRRAKATLNRKRLNTLPCCTAADTARGPLTPAEFTSDAHTKTPATEESLDVAEHVSAHTHLTKGVKDSVVWERVESTSDVKKDEVSRLPVVLGLLKKAHDVRD